MEFIFLIGLLLAAVAAVSGMIALFYLPGWIFGSDDKTDNGLLRDCGFLAIVCGLIAWTILSVLGPLM